MPPISHEIRRLRAIVPDSAPARFVLLFWVMVVFQNCLAPPPIEEAIDPGNQAPRIVTNRLAPPTAGGTFTISTSSDPCVFTALIADPDGDSIFWRVFIDYPNDANPSATLINESPADPVNPTGSRLLTFEVDPTDPRWGVASGRLQEPHAVELLISDRAFFEDARPPAGRALADDGFLDSFVWAIELIDDPNASQCITGSGF